MRSLAHPSFLLGCTFILACDPSPSAPPASPSSPPLNAPAFETIGMGPFDCYRTVTEVEAAMEDLAKSKVATIEPVGPSHDGRPLYAIKVTNPTLSIPPKPRVLILGGLHPREFAPPELVMRIAESLTAAYGIDASTTAVLNETEVYLIPLANPDGRIKVEDQDTNYTHWRKNTNPECQIYSPPDSGPGVDLNRNFGVGWGGGIKDVCDNRYQGLHSTSEVETQWLQQYIAKLFPEQTSAGMFFDVHAPRPGQTLAAAQELVLWPYSFQSGPADPAIEHLGHLIAGMANSRGAKAVPAANLIHPVGGGLAIDFVFDRGVPALALEIGTDGHQSCTEFLDDGAPIEAVYSRAIFLGILLAQDPYAGIDGPLMSFPFSFDPQHPNKIKAQPIGSLGNVVQLTAAAGDGTGVASIGYSLEYNPPGSQGPSNLASHGRSATALPPGGTIAEMLPFDGAFGDPFEPALAVILMDTMPVGRHFVHVHSVDDQGNPGVPSTVWLDNPGLNLGNATTFAFSGTVSHIDTTGSFPPNLMLPGFAFASGDRFSGWFAFDPNTPDASATDTILGRYDGAVIAATISFENGWSASGDTSCCVNELGRFAGIRVVEGTTTDSFQMSVLGGPRPEQMLKGPEILSSEAYFLNPFDRKKFGFQDFGSNGSMSFYLSDPTGSALTTDALPTSALSPSAFDTAQMTIEFFGRVRGERMEVAGKITSMNAVNPAFFPQSR